MAAVAEASAVVAAAAAVAGKIMKRGLIRASFFVLATSGGAFAHPGEAPPTAWWNGFLLAAFVGLVILEGWIVVGRRGKINAERVWMAAPLLILAAVGLTLLANRVLAGTRAVVYADEAIPADALAIDVEARQYAWRFQVPGKAASSAELRVPQGRDVVLRLRSKDVLHSFEVPDLGLRRDVIYGRVSPLGFRADTPGRYPIDCSVLCGSGAEQMRAILVVEDPNSWSDWLARPR